MDSQKGLAKELIWKPLGQKYIKSPTLASLGEKVKRSKMVS